VSNLLNRLTLVLSPSIWASQMHRRIAKGNQSFTSSVSSLSRLAKPLESVSVSLILRGRVERGVLRLLTSWRKGDKPELLLVYFFLVGRYRVGNAFPFLYRKCQSRVLLNVRYAGRSLHGYALQALAACACLVDRADRNRAIEMLELQFSDGATADSAHILSTSWRGLFHLGVEPTRHLPAVLHALSSCRDGVQRFKWVYSGMLNSVDLHRHCISVSAILPHLSTKELELYIDALRALGYQLHTNYDDVIVRDSQRQRTEGCLTTRFEDSSVLHESLQRDSRDAVSVGMSDGVARERLSMALEKFSKKAVDAKQELGR